MSAGSAGQTYPSPLASVLLRVLCVSLVGHRRGAEIGSVTLAEGGRAEAEAEVAFLWIDEEGVTFDSVFAEESLAAVAQVPVDDQCPRHPVDEDVRRAGGAEDVIAHRHSVGLGVLDQHPTTPLRAALVDGIVLERDVAYLMRVLALPPVGHNQARSHAVVDHVIVGTHVAQQTVALSAHGQAKHAIVHYVVEELDVVGLSVPCVGVERLALDVMEMVAVDADVARALLHVDAFVAGVVNVVVADLHALTVKLDGHSLLTGLTGALNFVVLDHDVGTRPCHDAGLAGVHDVAVAYADVAGSVHEDADGGRISHLQAVDDYVRLAAHLKQAPHAPQVGAVQYRGMVRSAKKGDRLIR